MPRTGYTFIGAMKDIAIATTHRDVLEELIAQVRKAVPGCEVVGPTFVLRGLESPDSPVTYELKGLGELGPQVVIWFVNQLSTHGWKVSQQVEQSEIIAYHLALK